MREFRHGIEYSKHYVTKEVFAPLGVSASSSIFCGRFHAGK